MSKPVKQLVVKSYKQRFSDVEGAVLVDLRGMHSNDNNALRLGLRKKSIRITVVKNSLAQQALEGTALDALRTGLSGPCALTYGGASVVDVARELVTWLKKVANLTLRGAVLDGEYYDGEAGVKRLSKFPTREEAQAKVVQLFLSPARNVVGAVTSPGGKLLGIVKTIQDRLEKGETIAKVA